MDNKRYYAVVGDNGYAFTTMDGLIIEAVRVLRNVSIMEMPDELSAQRYAVAAYCNRYIMRNFSLGGYPMIPLNLPVDELYIDEDFDKREGEKCLSYFPGIPM